MTTIKFSTSIKSANPKTCSAIAYEEMCKNFNCYEYIPDDIFVKPYFDIEIKPKDCVEGTEYNQCQSEIFQLVQQKLSAVFPGAKYCALDSSSPNFICCKEKTVTWRLSLHIVITNYKIMKSHLNSIISRFNKSMAIDDYYQVLDNFKVFDESVYDKNRKLRSAFACKDDGNGFVETDRPMTILEGTFQDSVISAFFDENTTTIEPQLIAEQTKKNESSGGGLLELFHPKGASVTSWREDILNETTDQTKKSKFIQLLNIIGNKGHSHGEWVSICAWCKTHSTLEQLLEFVEPAWIESTHTMWNSLQNKNIPIYWIQTFAKKKISSAAYTEWLNANDTYFIKAMDVMNSYEVSRTIANTLKHTLVLCKEQWYMLQDNQLWKQQKEPNAFIIKEIYKYLDYSNLKNAQKLSTCTDEAQRPLLVKNQNLYTQAYTKTIHELGHIGKFLRTFLVDDDFADKLDCNAGELAFQNGIIDLRTKEFRAGISSEDFITQTIPFNYSPGEHNKKIFIKNVLKKILNNNEDHLEYFLSLIGYTLIGSPQLEKSLYFGVDKTERSSGDNGKTFFFSILNDLMPNYIYKTQKTFLEEDNKKIHKQLVMMKGKRLVWGDEFGTKKVNADLLKEIADGLKIENEVMFGTSESIKIMFKLWLLTNHMPKIDAKDTAVYNRYKQISYGSHFDRTGSRTIEEPGKLLFIADTSLGDLIKNEYYNEVFDLVIEYGHKYYQTKLPTVPKQFANDSKDTQKNNDEFLIWFDENTVIDESKRVALKVLAERSGLSEKLVKEGMMRKGFKYDKDLRKVGQDYNGKHYKGGYSGCDVIEEEINEESDDSTAPL